MDSFQWHQKLMVTFPKHLILKKQALTTTFQKSSLCAAIEHAAQDLLHPCAVAFVEVLFSHAIRTKYLAHFKMRELNRLQYKKGE